MKNPGPVGNGPVRRWSARLPGLAMFALAIPVGGAEGGILTARVGITLAAPVPLVIHSDDWHYRKGTNEPPANWTTMADGALDSSWGIGPGGLGYGDGDDATIFPDMQGAYFSIYARKSFEIVSLIADLSLVESSPQGNVTGDLFCLTTHDTVQLSGTSTMPGSTRVTVNGLDATPNLATGTWVRMQTLEPGMNRLHIAALDANGMVLTSTNLEVVF